MSTFRYLNEEAVDRAVEAQLRSSAQRRVRPATTIVCAGPPLIRALDAYEAAEDWIAEWHEGSS